MIVGFSLSIKYAKITPNGTSVCTNRTAAEALLVTVTNQNLPEANKFAAQSRALRELRDEMELSAYGMLQSAAATRKEIDRLTVLLNELKDQQLDSYGWHLVWSVLK